jgi:hypothetical protein
MSHSSNSHKRRAAGYVFVVAGLMVFAVNTLNITSDGFDLIPFLLASTSVLLSVGLGTYLVGSSRSGSNEDRCSNVVTSDSAT